MELVVIIDLFIVLPLVSVCVCCDKWNTFRAHTMENCH